MGENRRVVVTGLGVVSSIGLGVDAYYRSLLAGRSGASLVKAFGTQKFPSHVGCEVTDFAPEKWRRDGSRHTLGRSSLFAIAAARMALQHAGLAEEILGDHPCDVVMGTTDGEAGVFDAFAAAIRNEQGELPDDLLCLPMAEAISDAVQAEFGLDGDSVMLATACSAGNYALSYAWDKIAQGAVDVALCGGSDAQCLKNFGGFYRIGGLAPEKCQPFDRNRKGILPGEGAGVLVLEALPRALARNALILAEVLGYGTSCDGVHIMAPDRSGIVMCARDALERCRVRPEEVDYICAHGTGTAVNDVVETAAMREVFGASLPPMSSIKSMLGHTMGAASALSAIACVLALTEQFLPPTINFSEPDPECVLDCVPNHSRPCRARLVQNNAFAFGGNNAIVLFKRWE